MIGLVEQMRASAENLDWVAMIGLVEQLRNRAVPHSSNAAPAQPGSSDPSDRNNT